ncbi:MAG: putative glycosyltransferase EpsJ [Candidatus Ordinivivax streblomastigis]|uniref:Putative glycosyltransferase EpsJ n=1 Tax=Candidatus Ordinivivax streblomastigis TaxID=2540710 RepID=A0A5M8P201_9BACT|nr:MAG: putative glycosyltransferase EpsJ [Candidatus Ordinivivax streblomastigis]
MVSVIVLAYNVGEYIENCLHSIISQSYVNLDIIVVINGKSRDNTETIVEQMAQSDHRIRLVYNRENSYISDGRKLGLDAVKGEYFTFVDGDDYLPEDAVANLMSLMKVNDVDIVIGSIGAFTNGMRHICF